MSNSSLSSYSIRKEQRSPDLVLNSDKESVSSYTYGSKENVLNNGIALVQAELDEEEEEEMIESDEAEESEKFLQPMNREDIEGMDEDLTAVEEFYLCELEKTVKHDLIRQITLQESNLKSEIQKLKNRCLRRAQTTEVDQIQSKKLTLLMTELAKQKQQNYQLAFKNISQKNKQEVDEINDMMHESEEELKISENTLLPSQK